MLDRLNKETIMQKRIKVYDKIQHREIGHLNPCYPFRIFARSRYNGDYLRPAEIDIICRFMTIYITQDTLSVNEVLYRLGTDVVSSNQQIYDILNKQDIIYKDITRVDRTIMYFYCHNDYNFEKTKEFFIKYFISKEDAIEEKINHALEVFGVDKLIWNDDLDKFVYDNYTQHYDSYDSIKQDDKRDLQRMGSSTNSYLGDRNDFGYKNFMFKYAEEKYGTDFIIENYYDTFEFTAKSGSYINMLNSLQRNEDEIKLEDVQWLVDHEWALDLIQREMGFSSRYALKRYLDKYAIDYSKCKKRPGRPRGTFKNGSARNQIYEDFTKGLVPDTIYDKYKDKYSKRSIDRIYNEWKKDQEPLFD